MGESEPLSFTVRQTVAKPPAEVFRAIVEPGVSTRYFMATSTGALTKGSSVVWTWASYPPVTVEVEDAVPGEAVRFRWESHPGGPTSVVAIALSAAAGGGTAVEITEGSWPDTPAGRKAAFDNCGGWQHMLLCLKAWLEHGIDLRT
ncbi:MAG: SRPBCC domain-containing protein [Phycisphaerales bacterium]